MNDDHEIMLPLITGIFIVILFCVVMLIKGTNTEAYKVSVIVSNSSSDRWVPFKAGLEQAANDNSIILDYVYTDYIDNIYTENSIINEEISQGANGIIADFCLSEGAEDVVESISARVPIMLVETNVNAGADIRGNHATVMPDNYAIGRAIGNEVVIDYGVGLKGKKIGIVAGNQNQYAMQQRLKGFMDATEKMSPEIVWSISESRYTEDDLIKASERNTADIVVGLDNNSLELAVDYFVDKKGGYVRLYGSGCSKKLIYHIDAGELDSMIVPDDFSMGYQSMSDLAIKLQNRTSALMDREVGFSVVNRENLFVGDNQQILFPIVQ